MDILYHILVGAAILIASPFVAVKAVLSPSFREDLLHRSRGADAIDPVSKSVWLHAASVGEVRAALILIKALKDEGWLPTIVLSTFTRTGYDLAKKEDLVPVFRLPPDVPFFIAPIFGRLNPSLLVLIEAELWPCLLRTCKRRGVPVILVNGRITEQSCRTYSRIKSFFGWMTRAVELFSMRSETDAKRIARLGIASERITVTGNMKFDAPVAEPPAEQVAKDWQESPLMVFGSTRPGEEGAIVEAVRHLQRDFPQLKCVLAPRHVERSQEVERLIRDYKMEFKLFSSWEHEDENELPSLLLLDRIGELEGFYRRSCVAFVGGGFNPRFGGHNILEPAAYHQPVIFGKYMNNFAEEAELLSASGGGIQIDRLEELYSVLHRLLNDSEERTRRGKAAGDTVLRNRGAVRRNVDLIQKLLAKTSSRD